MANDKMLKMKEVYAKFPEELKLNLSMARIYEYSDLSRIPKEHKKILEKEFAKIIKEKNMLRSKVLKTLTAADRKIVRENYSDYAYEADMLGLDLENTDNLINLAKDEITTIKCEYDSYKRSKKKEATRNLEKLRSEVLMYCVAREKIKFYYDAISNNAKYGLKAIKIRKRIEKKQRKQIQKIDDKIARLTKILNDNGTN